MPTSREEYRTIMENCVTRFSELHPDCGFTLETFSLRIVEPEAFVDAILDTPTENSSTLSRYECICNHDECDAILIRGSKGRTIIVKYKPDVHIAMLLVSLYHEIAHEYVMCRETESGFILADPKQGEKAAHEFSSGGILPGYLLWKEFIADYLAYDALHHMLKRISATGRDGIDAMAELIPRMCGNVLLPTTGSFSAMANACAIIMNFDGFHAALYDGKLAMPVSRRKRVGRDLYDIIVDLLFLLTDRVESENPYAITDEFLNNLGHTAVEVQLYHEDYSAEIGWEGSE